MKYKYTNEVRGMNAMLSTFLNWSKSSKIDNAYSGNILRRTEDYSTSNKDMTKKEEENFYPGHWPFPL